MEHRVRRHVHLIKETPSSEKSRQTANSETNNIKKTKKNWNGVETAPLRRENQQAEEDELEDMYQAYAISFPDGYWLL